MARERDIKDFFKQQQQPETWRDRLDTGNIVPENLGIKESAFKEKPWPGIKEPVNMDEGPGIGIPPAPKRISDTLDFRDFDESQEIIKERNNALVNNGLNVARTAVLESSAGYSDTLEQNWDTISTKVSNLPGEWKNLTPDAVATLDLAMNKQPGSKNIEDVIDTLTNLGQIKEQSLPESNFTDMLMAFDEMLTTNIKNSIGTIELAKTSAVVQNVVKPFHDKLKTMAGAFGSAANFGTLLENESTDFKAAYPDIEDDIETRK